MYDLEPNSLKVICWSKEINFYVVKVPILNLIITHSLVFMNYY